MAQATVISAARREHLGKGASRAARRDGQVPGIIYGDNKDPVPIAMDPTVLSKQIRQTGFFSRVFEVDVGGEKHRVLARDLQLDPLTDRPIHVDFMRFGADTRLNVEVEVVFENEHECPGIRRGGVLNVVRHTVELSCLADNIPEFISMDLTGLEIGDSVHISAVALPQGVSPTVTDRDFTIATIAAPTLLPVEEEEVEEGAEDALEEGAEDEAAAAGEEEKPDEE
ncbi:MAG TPA: 50S ribosomal protein L25/general stress protein Ctc [Rhodospirillales bacterium]|jgi:large subunit ribosomal protein L25|nr:50S ribosomal protein L25/general stress protein Ctc [Rhodospirillales bacterium]HJO68187.1 50S ribosomal protein L25/general stress protein Ctc [Rhodospirillales bacterium]